jgi:type IV pilus assembly protein PilA
MRKRVFLYDNKNSAKKKGGFTLIEVIAVIAIIGILAASILPKVSGYVKEAKKTKVVDQCRKVVMAVESYNLTSSTPIAKTAKVSTAIATNGVKKYLEGELLNNLDTVNTTVQKCYDIIGGAEFDIDDQTEKLVVGT